MVFALARRGLHMSKIAFSCSSRPGNLAVPGVGHTGHILLVLLTVALADTLTEAWGPYTHQIFGCKIAGASIPATCLDSTSHRMFALGNSSPDAFKVLGSTYHDLTFAGYMYLYAASLNTTQFNATAFALGYGCHLAADGVGHHAGGYIGSADHKQEFAVDTYEMRSYVSSRTTATTLTRAAGPRGEESRARIMLRGGKQQDGSSFQSPPSAGAPNAEYSFQTLDSDVITFMTEFSSYYSHIDQSFRPPNSTQLTSSADAFNTLTGEEGPLIAINFLYEEEMIKWDTQGAKTWAQALSHIENATGRVEVAAKFWLSRIRTDRDPVRATSSTMAFINSLFK